MKDFDYKYKDLKYRIKPFEKLREEERSWIIFRLYKLNILENEDIKDYVRKKYLRSLTHLSFPVLTFLFTHKYLKMHPNMVRVFNSTNHLYYSVGFTAASWLIFTRINPFKYYHRYEKIKLLEYIDN